MKRVVVTGAAGFIGFHVIRRLLLQGDQVLGIDNLNDYYDVQLKLARLKLLGVQPITGNVTSPDGAFRFVYSDICERDRLVREFKAFRPDCVCHLAAQAGVRYAIENPDAYVHSNLAGFLSVLEACRIISAPHLVYASSSSVYGLNATVPFRTGHCTDHPASFYGATKKANEVMAHSYSHIYGLPCTGLRFFTVYGPWGRPDMAPVKFAQAIMNEQPIQVYNEGNMLRDFTYIDDISAVTAAILDHPAMSNASWDSNSPDPASSSAPYRVFNLGNSSPVRLLDFVSILESALGKRAKCEMVAMQKGDVVATWADSSPIEQEIGMQIHTPLKQGLQEFASWFKSFYFPESRALDESHEQGG